MTRSYQYSSRIIHIRTPTYPLLRTNKTIFDSHVRTNLVVLSLAATYVLYYTIVLQLQCHNYLKVITSYLKVKVVLYNTLLLTIDRDLYTDVFHALLR